MRIRVIVSAIIQKNDAILLGKKAKGKPPHPDVWHLPSGGVDDQERALELLRTHDYNNKYFIQELIREVAEEVGITIKNITNIIPSFRDVPREGSNKDKDGEETRYYFLEYLCDYDSGDVIPGDDLVEAEWVPKNDLRNRNVTEPSVEMYKELGWLE